MAITNNAAAERPFTVLFVCTANQCRSPLAENLFRASLNRLDVDWAVTSAGVITKDGNAMHARAAAVLDERGVAHAGWASQRLTAARVAAADLVLTAEMAHRQTVVTMQPAAVRYSFTLLQFSRLLALSPAGDEPAMNQDAGLELIRRAELARSRPQSRDEHQLELADPIGEPIDAFRRTADTIEEALLVIEHALRSQRADTSQAMAGLD